MGSDDFGPELYPFPGPTRGSRSHYAVRWGPIRIVADDIDRPHRAERHPIHNRQLSRAAARRRHSRNFAVPGAVRRILLELSLGDTGSVHRRSDYHRHPDNMRPVRRESLAHLAAFRSGEPKQVVKDETFASVAVSGNLMI